MGRIPDHLVSLAVRALENRWVTIGAKVGKNTNGKKKGGTPVELDGEGKITKGPAALTGKRPSELSQSHMFSGQDHKSQRKLFAEPGDPPPPPPIDEAPKAPAPAAKKEPKPRAKKPLSMSLMAVIRREGGISSGDFEHADFKEFGLLGALNKKGLSLDDMAATMVRQGHMTVPMGKSSPSDHLLQLLKKKTNSLLAADTAEYDKDYQAYMQAREEAQADGYEEGQLEEVRGRGEEAGGNESKDRLFDEIFGGDGGGGEEAGRDEEPGDLAGDSAEPAGGVDTSFDFGPAAAPRVEEKPKAAKPRKPKQKKDWEDRQEEKHQKALADIKAADAEKAAVATKARELLGKVTDPGQKAQLQKLIDQAEGKQEQAPAPPVIKPQAPAPPPAVAPDQPSAPVAGASKPTPPKPPERRYGEKAPKSKLSNPPQDERTYSEKDKEKLVANMRRAVDSKKDPEQVVKSLKIDPTFTSKSQMKTELDLIRDNFPQVYQALKDNPGALGKDLHDEVAQHTGGQGPEAFDFDAEQVRADKAFKPGTPLDRKAPTPPPPATNLFGQPEPTKPQPATTQGLFGEQVPVEDPKVKPRETIADQAEKGLDWLDQKQDPKTDGTGEMFGGLFSPGRTSGATEPEAGPVAAPTVEPSPAATAPAPQSQSFDDYRRANGVKGYTIDHSMLSPNGKVSGRSANAAQARVDKQFSDYSQAEKEYQAKVDAGEIVDPKGKYQKPDQAKANKGEADRLRNMAKQFRSIAERGMQTRKLTKQAEELERQANELDPVAKAEAGPVAAPKVETAKPAPFKFSLDPSGRRGDTAEVNIPFSKRGDLNAQIDRFKRNQRAEEKKKDRANRDVFQQANKLLKDNEKQIYGHYAKRLNKPIAEIKRSIQNMKMRGPKFFLEFIGKALSESKPEGTS